jgi:hypothetical protein
VPAAAPPIGNRQAGIFYFTSGYRSRSSLIGPLIVGPDRNAGNGNSTFIEANGDIFSRVAGTLMDGPLIIELVAALTIRIFMRVVGVQIAKLMGDFGIPLQGVGQIDVPKITGPRVPAQQHL